MIIHVNINLSLFSETKVIFKSFSGKGVIIKVVNDVGIVEAFRVIIFRVAVFAL